MKIISENLVAAREKKGYSQAELAKKANVSKSSINNWEINRGNPNYLDILAIGEALGLSDKEIHEKIIHPDEHTKLPNIEAANCPDQVKPICDLYRNLQSNKKALADDLLKEIHKKLDTLKNL